MLGVKERAGRVGQTAWVHWLLVPVGLLSVAAGVVILAKPAIALATLAVIAGIFLLLDGIVEVFVSFLARDERESLSVLIGIASVVVGILLIRHPIPGITAVELLVGLWLIASGVVRAIWTFAGRGHPIWMVLVAMVEVAAGILLVSSTSIGVRTLGLFLGISFIARGVLLCVIGWLAGRIADKLQQPPHDAVAAT